jgi:8-oxo-dGTP pyrophosphatase MutT (NUDIX family)
MTTTHLTVAAVVEHLNRFLLVEELIDGRKLINQPAGHVENNETLVEAVIREVREETAWRFNPTAIVGVYLWTHPDTQDRFLRVTYTGHTDDHLPEQKLDEGILRTLWLSRDQLSRRRDSLRSPMVMRAVEDYRSGQRFPVTMFQQVGIEDLAANAQLVR